MNLLIFSLRSIFYANDLSHSGGCCTRPSRSSGDGTQTASPSPLCRFAPRGYPEYSSSIGYLPAGRQEIDIRCENYQVHSVE